MVNVPLVIDWLFTENLRTLYTGVNFFISDPLFEDISFLKLKLKLAFNILNFISCYNVPIVLSWLWEEPFDFCWHLAVKGLAVQRRPLPRDA